MNLRPTENTGDWTSLELRPGALFLVGDPKQAIYRFRGADIAAYVRAREAFLKHAPDGVLPISTNFRSCAPIMRYVNERFESLLSTENGQPGFQALDPFQLERADRAIGHCVGYRGEPMKRERPLPCSDATAKRRLLPQCALA